MDTDLITQFELARTAFVDADARLNQFNEGVQIDGLTRGDALLDRADALHKMIAAGRAVAIAATEALDRLDTYPYKLEAQPILDALTRIDLRHLGLPSDH